MATRRVLIKRGALEGTIGRLSPVEGVSKYAYVQPEGGQPPILLKEDEYEYYFERPVTVNTPGGQHHGIFGDIILMHEDGRWPFEVLLYPGDSSDGLFAIPLAEDEFVEGHVEL